MIEVVSAERCIACDKCIAVCPTNVFDRGERGVPVISRHEDCQTCFQCEANCPVDALFVAPFTDRQPGTDEQSVTDDGLMGSYREQIGWGKGRKPGTKSALGPAMGFRGSPIIS
ncbi:4Fe-4S ferredoxin [Mycobacteroides abscessus subsp. abscessus]|uniref:4Fe-4S dicluster domain-containing protein n=1 Tax=Mycobacteroides abscessus TaxID=36809 RepID=UPI0009A59B6A|nr:ferredoxin family protein [Mycobacteroides abscessus]SLI10633.1 4Fe-4S ferredoxin [Mycobacteroides abscessus subsp. abscessus]